jgi:hypothetical protein
MKAKLALCVAMVFAQLPSTAHACTVCMGGDDSKVGPAMNAAIFLLLGCIGGVLASLAAFGICLIRRARAPLPAGAELHHT